MPTYLAGPDQSATPTRRAYLPVDPSQLYPPPLFSQLSPVQHSTPDPAHTCTSVAMLLSARPWTPQEIHRVAPRPSPLSERPVMVINPAFSPTCTMHSRPESSQPFCKRIVKPNPLVRSPDAAKERRRGMFFKRVQQDREDRKWELRAEQVRRLPTFV